MSSASLPLRKFLASMGPDIHSGQIRLQTLDLVLDMVSPGSPVLYITRLHTRLQTR